MLAMKALELFEVRTPGVWLRVLELHAGSHQRGLLWVHIRSVGECNADHLGDLVIWLS
jgi:hypothetical protein